MTPTTRRVTSLLMVGLVLLAGSGGVTATVTPGTGHGAASTVGTDPTGMASLTTTPTATLDTNADIDNDGQTDEISVQQASGQTISGETTLEPGTELSVRVTGTDAGSPFVKPLSATVQDDGTFSTSADFSDNARGANFTVDVRYNSTSLLDEQVDGRIAEAPTASVTFNDQETNGSVVTVASTTLSTGGFVAIHQNNASGKILATSSYLDAGSHSDIPIEFNRSLDSDTTLVAMPHRDTDGDQAFEFEFGSTVDAPYTENGSAVTHSASVTVVPDLYAGGDGSAENPYRIADWTHLENVAQNRDAHFRLVTDLDESTAGYGDVGSSTANGGDGFTPIGDNSDRFTGTFDGDNHTIRGLYIDLDRDGGLTTDGVGLFGYVGAGGTVQNVHLRDVDVNNSNGFIGALVGVNEGTVASASMTGAVSSTGGSAGGLVGWNDGTVRDSYATGTVTGSGDSYGGLVGRNEEGTVQSSYATGNVTADDFVGGLLGSNRFGEVETSYTTGEVSGSGEYVGRLVGYAGGTVSDSYWETTAANGMDAVGVGSENTTGVAGLTPSEMRGAAAESNMGALDFAGTWTVVDDATAASYPYLRANAQSPAPGLSVTDRPTFDEGDSASLTIDEDSGATAIDSLLTVTDTDSEGTLNWTVASPPSNGSLSGFPAEESSGTGVTPSGLSFTPDDDFDGSDTFEIQVSDGSTTDTITVTITVRDAPEVASVTRTGSRQTNASSVTFNTTFTESVSGVTTGDFTATGVTGNVSGQVASIGTASGTAISVTVDNVTGEGDLRLDVRDHDNITGGDGVALGGVGTSDAGNGSYTSGENYTIDNTPPEFSAGRTNTGSIVTGTTGTVLDIDAGSDGPSGPDTGVTYTLVSRAGADAADFSIDEATGTVTLDSEAEFEDPGDADGNNEYELRVRATDTAGNSNTQNLTVVITEVTESSPDGTQTTDVASTPAGDSTPEATSAPATSVSDGTSTAPTATTPGSPTTTTGADGPGFGVVLTLTALLVAVGALARRSA